MFSKIRLDVDDKCCLFQEGGHLGPNLPPPDPVSPHFSPPDSIQRHHLAGFMKTVPSDTRSPHTLNWLNWSKYGQETQLLPMVLLRWLSSWFLISKRNIQVHQKDTLDLSIHSSCLKALNDGGRLRLKQVLSREFNSNSAIYIYIYIYNFTVIIFVRWRLLMSPLRNSKAIWKLR